MAYGRNGCVAVSLLRWQRPVHEFAKTSVFSALCVGKVVSAVDRGFPLIFWRMWPPTEYEKPVALINSRGKKIKRVS